jgi:hypothetical protein
MSILTSLLIIAFGAIFQFDLFLHNSFGLVFFTFFLFQLAMSSVAFLISVFISRSQVAVNIGFIVFLVGWITQVRTSFFTLHLMSHTSMFRAWGSSKGECTMESTGRAGKSSCGEYEN